VDRKSVEFAGMLEQLMAAEEEAGERKYGR